MPVNYGHHGSARMFALLQPTSGIRDEMMRKGIKPHDHTKDNRAKIRALEKLNRERQQANTTGRGASLQLRSRPSVNAAPRYWARRAASTATPCALRFWHRSSWMLAKCPQSTRQQCSTP